MKPKSEANEAAKQANENSSSGKDEASKGIRIEIGRNLEPEIIHDTKIAAREDLSTKYSDDLRYKINIEAPPEDRSSKFPSVQSDIQEKLVEPED